MNARRFIPFAILALGLVATVILVKMKPSAARQAPPKVALQVEVVTVSPQDHAVVLRSSGVARPARQVALSAQVAGAIVQTAAQLRPGGQFRKGEVIARIDARDYELAVTVEESRLKQAELELELELGRQGIARREWELLGDKRPEEEAALALRQPHLATAQQAVAAARSGLERARLNLERTTLRAPFNALVVEEHLDVGQVVGPGPSLVTLVGSDELWIEASLQVSDLAFLDLDREAPAARVVQSADADAGRFRTGKVVGLQGQLDPQTRKAGVLVSVEDPLEVEDGQLPLLPGAFTNVAIQGRTLPSSFVVPSAALYNGDTVWTVDAENRLASRTVALAWHGGDIVVLGDGLKAGDQVVVTPLSLPVNGQIVKILAPGAEPAGAATQGEQAPSGTEG